MISTLLHLLRLFPFLCGVPPAALEASPPATRRIQEDAESAAAALE
jgi:hypothetical protein